ncbi:MAG: FkbM family methyltransferase [Solirubrobacteraceae bacterium]|nr:FkbM family methyltransferase [Solirubrobacteraceae bacterium]
MIRVSGLRGDVAVLDIGGNVGQFGSTIRGSLPGSRVWSMEPNPEPLAHLQRNAAADDRWTILDYGVGDEDVDLDFWFVPGKSGQGSVHAENATLGLLGGEARQITVPVRRLTAERIAAAGMPTRIDLVKVDVEGAELQALSGLGAIQWGHLLLELSVGRSGSMTRDELLAHCASIWGGPVEVAAVIGEQAATQEIVLRNPAFFA